MIPKTSLFSLPGLSLSGIHIAGIFLFWAVCFMPVVGVLLYPNTPDSWQYFSFNGLISFIEISFIGIFILQRRQQNYGFTHLPKILWGAFLLWLAVILYTLPSAPNLTDAKTISSQFVLHFFFFVTLSSYLHRQPRAGAILLRAVLISFCGFLPVFWLKLALIHTQPGFDWGWSLPGFQNVRHLGYFLGVLAALLALSLRASPKNFPAKIIPPMLLLVCWVMLFWSGGRGSTLAAFSTIMAIYLLFRPNNWAKLVGVNILILTLAAVISLFLPAPDGSYGILRFLTKITETDSMNAFSAGRTQFWIEAFHIWQQNLWTGVGAGQTRTVLAAASGTFAQPHNVFLQAFMAWGLFGGLPFLASLFILFWNQTKTFLLQPETRTPIALSAFGMALTLAINALVDGTLYYPAPLFLFIIGITIAGTVQVKGRD